MGGQRVTEELKTTIAAMEKDIADSITNTDRQLSLLNTQFNQLSSTKVKQGITSGTEEVYEDSDEAGMHRTTGEGRAMLEILLELLESLKRTIQDEARKFAEKQQDPSVTFGDRNSGFQLGINRGDISGFTFGGHVSREGSGI